MIYQGFHLFHQIFLHAICNILISLKIFNAGLSASFSFYSLVLMYIKHISKCRYYIKSVNNKFWKQQITSKIMSSLSGIVSNAPPCHSNVNDGIFQCCFSDACRYVCVMEIERAQKGMDKKPKSQTCM